jgi:hypothetical protein
MRAPGKTVKERQEHQRKIEEKYALTLRTANEKKAKKEPKRQPVDVLKDKVITDVTYDHVIRPPETYLNRSYNQDKQIVGLIRHLFVKYPTPSFLYEVCRKDYKPKMKKFHADYILWFLALAQGKSFTKLVKPYMTSKEAYHFLSAPYTEVHENVWWAKLKTADIPAGVAHRLIERVFKSQSFDDKSGRLAELIVFYAHYHQDMDKGTLDAVNDFVVWKLHNDNDFRFKGRTASSMIKLSNEWHELMQKAKLGKYIVWNGLGIPDWTHYEKQEIWTMEELLDNKELANEGRKQKHCVFSYVNQCAAGTCNIFSLRGWSKGHFGNDEEGEPIYRPVSEFYRITVEVRNREVVQVKGALNRAATSRELDMLKMWAGEKGLTISQYALSRRW